jgi:uncharacterized protein
MTEAPSYHQVAGDPGLVLMVRSSALVRLGAEAAALLQRGDPRMLEALRPLDRPSAAAAAHEPRAPRAVSLNVATSCNLGCAYCYADRGAFRGPRRPGMSAATMRAAVDRLVSSNAGGRVTLGFIGGEPFANPGLVHEAVAYARSRAAAEGAGIGFSVTTNGTLLRDADVALLRDNAFTVTVSIDGSAAVHDRVRPAAGGGATHARAVAAILPLLRDPGGARVSARATLTRLDLGVARIVADLRAIGFEEVGVSPLRTGPRPDLALRNEDWGVLLVAMREAAAAEWNSLLGGARPAFANLTVALREIAVGASRSLPCGAADNYVSVSAEGTYSACHRTIDDERFALGDVGSGLSQDVRRTFLAERHVDRQEPCRTCWARYLCGGGCHAEVAEAGRDGCDYVRGWLETCLRYYDAALRVRPDLLHEEASS